MYFICKNVIYKDDAEEHKATRLNMCLHFAFLCVPPFADFSFINTKPEKIASVLGCPSMRNAVVWREKLGRADARCLQPFRKNLHKNIGVFFAQ